MSFDIHNKTLLPILPKNIVTFPDKISRSHNKLILLQQEFSKHEVRESTYVVRDSSYSSVEEKQQQQQQQSFLSNRPPRDPAGGARTETDAAHARFRYAWTFKGQKVYYVIKLVYIIKKSL